MEDLHIINVYTTDPDGVEKIIFSSSDLETVRNFIGNAGTTLNKGYYHFWELDDKYYYNYGTVTYYTKEPIKVESKSDCITPKITK